MEQTSNSFIHTSFLSKVLAKQYFAMAYITCTLSACVFNKGISLDFIRLCALGLLAIPLLHLRPPKPIRLYAYLGFALPLFAYISNWLSPWAQANLLTMGSLLHWLLVMPIYVLCLWAQPSLEQLRLILSIATACVLIPITHDLVTGHTRYEGFHSSPIYWGNLSLLTGTLASYLWLSTGKSTRHLMLAVSTLLTGVLASVVSETRGGWPFILVSTGFIIHKARHQFNLKPHHFTLPIVLSLTILFIPELKVLERIQTTSHNVHRYISGDQQAKKSSIGQRFGFWQASIEAIQERPFWGIGSEGFTQFLYRNDTYKGERGRRWHTHNDYLGMLIRGIPAAFCMLFIVGNFIATLRKTRDTTIANAANQSLVYTLGLMVCFAYGIFCLSENFISGKLGSAYFLFISIYLLTLSQNLQADQK